MTSPANTPPSSATSSISPANLWCPIPTGNRKKRVQYWTALALLRGVMSSPKAGVKMLNTRIDRLAEADRDADRSDRRERRKPSSRPRLWLRRRQRAHPSPRTRRFVGIPAPTNEHFRRTSREPWQYPARRQALCGKRRPGRVARKGIQSGRLLPIHRHSSIPGRTSRPCPAAEVSKTSIFR